MLDKVDEWLARCFGCCCSLCGLPSGSARVCGGCRADLPWIHSGCSRCGRPLPSGASAGLCGGCDLALAGLDRVRAALVYEYPVDAMIVASKFHARVDLARALGELLAEWLSPAPPACEFVLPVPLHPARLAWRGYNQACEIALPLSRRLGMPLDRGLCRRVRNTSAQSGLSARQRRANLRAAFVADRLPRGASVLLVDDVVTTGHTLSSLAKSLRAGGAASVEALCAARVVRGQAVRYR